MEWAGKREGVYHVCIVARKRRPETAAEGTR
jgi:hypothetical protein